MIVFNKCSESLYFTHPSQLHTAVLKLAGDRGVLRLYRLATRRQKCERAVIFGGCRAWLYCIHIDRI